MIRMALGLSACLFCGLLSGCASVIGSYPENTAPVKHAVAEKNYPQALKILTQNQARQNQDLDGVERGRVEQLSGNFKASEMAYHQVIQDVQQQQLEAKIQVHRVLETTGSLLGNDQMLPYRLKSYEIVFLYTYQALNYLGEGDLTDALVSIRQGQNEQSYIQQTHEAELLKAHQEAQKQGFDVNTEDHSQYFQTTMAAAKGIKSSFENAFFYYFSALLFDMQGDYNNAFVSIQRALALSPDNPEIQKFLIQILQQRSGNLDQMQRYLEKFGSSQALVTPIPEHSDLVAVIVEQGWVQPLSSITVPILTFTHDASQGGTLNFNGVMFSIPIYAKSSVVPLIAEVKIDHQRTTLPVLMSVKPLAAKALTEDYPIIIVREVLRVIAKQVLAAQVQRKGGLAGEVAVLVYNVVSSNADLRSWLTLPQDIQVWQDFLPLGPHRLSIEVNGVQESIPLDLQANTNVVIWAASVGPSLIVHRILVHQSSQ